MLLQTNSYVVPKEKRSQHVRLVRRFKQCLARLGCDDYEVYEQVGTNWTSDQTGGRYVQIMRFRDRRHQLAVQAAERSDPIAQAIIAEFCELINFPYQQQQGLFAIGFYTSILASTPRALPHEPAQEPPPPQAGGPVESVADQMAEAGTPVTEAGAAVLEPSEREVAEEMAIAQAAAEAPPPASPFADGPPVAEPHPLQEPQPDLDQSEIAVPEPEPEAVEAGKNGDAIDHPAADSVFAASAEEPPAEKSAEFSVAALDELIRQRFGTIETPPPAQEAHDETPEDAPADQPPSEPIPSSSGIGEILDASLGDDPDLDIVLPAELLDGPEQHKVHQQHEAPSEGSHTAEPNHG